MLKKLLGFAVAAAFTMSASAEVLQLDLNEPLSTWGSETYNTETHTITYPSAWGGAGWGFWGNGDFSKYDQFVIEFEPVDFMVQLFCQYVDAEDAQTAMAMPGDEECVLNLNPEYSDNVGQIFIQASAAGDLTLKSAYFRSENDIELETVLWTGRQELDWWENAIKLSKSKFAAVREDYILAISYEVVNASENSAIKLQTLNKDWSTTPLPCMQEITGDMPAGQYYPYLDDDGVDVGGSVGLYYQVAALAMVIDEETLQLLKGDIQGVMIVGSNVVVKRVQIIDNNFSNVYAVGEFQGWDPEHPVAMTCVNEDDMIFELKIDQPIKSLKLSLIPEGDWSIFNIATLVPENALENGEPQTFVYGTTDILLPWEGVYTITVNFDQETIMAYTETPEPNTEYPEIYLRGGMNGWGADDAYKFSTEDGIVYTLGGIDLEAGVEWKIASADWSTVDLGGISAAKFDTEYIMAWQGYNCTLAKDATDARFTLNLSTRTLLITNLSGISAIESSEAPAVYYNMQGMRISNPQSGQLYIVKRGDSVTKQIIR